MESPNPSGQVPDASSAPAAPATPTPQPVPGAPAEPTRGPTPTPVAVPAPVGYTPQDGPAPTVGRIVHFWAPDGVANPLAAIIVRVHSDTCVNLSVFDDGTARYTAGGVNSAVKRTAAAEPGAWDWPARV